MSIFNENALKGKVVFITGGGTGIGFGISKILGKHGAKIGIASRRQAVIDKAVNELVSLGIDAYGCTIDVKDPEKCAIAVENIKSKFGKIDVLVNNAAGNFMSSVENLSFNGFKTVLDIDLIGCFNVSKAVLPLMKEQKDGLIINISATLHYKATPFQMHASAAKAGIDVLTNNIGVEWGEYGIRCVGIAPGPIEGTVGGPTGRVFGQKNNPMKAENMMPLSKFGTVEDIGYMVLYLSTEIAKFITATTIVVDGGQWHGSTMMFKMMKKMIKSKSTEEKQNFKGGVAKAKL